jgi:hypothetical protein
VFSFGKLFWRLSTITKSFPVPWYLKKEIFIAHITSTNIANIKIILKIVKRALKDICKKKECF